MAGEFKVRPAWIVIPLVAAGAVLPWIIRMARGSKVPRPWFLISVLAAAGAAWPYFVFRFSANVFDNSPDLGYFAVQMPFVMAVYWFCLVLRELWKHGRSALWLLSGAPAVFWWPFLWLKFGPD